MLADLALLRDAGRDPVLNIIYGYPKDEEGGPVPTDVMSWHVDSAPVESDTWLCTYHGAPSEGLLNEHAIRKVDDPKIRSELLKIYDGPEDESFTEWLSENHYDLHYAPKPDATSYSFGQFNLTSAESASFSHNGPNPVSNIIGRVTGGSVSSIDGLISSNIPGANLFLLNPSGILFGPNAKLDVQGSFHASTADYLRLADGGVYFANPAATSVLTVAAPSAFCFLAENPAGLTVQGAVMSVPSITTLPRSGLSRPIRCFKSTLLPPPLWPMTAINWPCPMLKFTPLRTC